MAFNVRSRICSLSRSAEDKFSHIGPERSYDHVKDWCIRSKPFFIDPLVARKSKPNVLKLYSAKQSSTEAMISLDKKSSPKGPPAALLELLTRETVVSSRELVQVFSTSLFAIQPHRADDPKSRTAQIPTCTVFADEMIVSSYKQPSFSICTYFGKGGKLFQEAHGGFRVVQVYSFAVLALSFSSVKGRCRAIRLASLDARGGTFHDPMFTFDLLFATISVYSSVAACSRRPLQPTGMPERVFFEPCLPWWFPRGGSLVLHQ
ncbi:hypothetical protein KCU73_g127, partial [Aureobasidium melanogenum]